MDSSGDLTGRVVAEKYAVLSVIGSGAMGVVYRARQIALDKIVALKVISDGARGDAEFVTRFHTEAKSASRLDHPNSTRVLDFGDDNGLLYIAMELLQGRTLAELLNQEFPLAPARIAAIMTQTLSAVGAAHAIKIVHRDLKPENIVILDGRDDEDRHVDIVKVCDFGIAKVEGAVEPTDSQSRIPISAKATRAGVVIGTPQYMSPEQARGESLDYRSDLYSLGVVLYEILTRRAPFDEGTPADVLYKHSYAIPDPPSKLFPDVDPALEAICLRALQKKPADRYASAREMRHAFRPLAGTIAMDVTPAPRESAPRPMGESSVPTITATASSNPTRRSAGRALWLAPLVIAATIAIAFGVVHKRATRTASTQTQTQTPTLTLTPTLTQTLTQTPTPTPTQTPTRTDLAMVPAPTATSRAPLGRHPLVAATATAAVLETATVEPVTTIAPIATVTATATATAIPTPPIVIATAIATARTDPATAHVDIGHVDADRVGAASVESVLRHIDFTTCYRTALAQSVSDGNATLVLEMDEDRITRADMVGGTFTPALRQCISHRALGTRIPNVDTGAATAKVTLRFALK